MSTQAVRPPVVSMTSAQKRDQIIQFLLQQSEESDKMIDRLQAEVNAYSVRNAQQIAQIGALETEIARLQGTPASSSPNAEATA